MDPLLVGERVAVHNQEILGVHQDGLSQAEVSHLIHFLPFEGTAGLVSADNLTGQFLALEQQWLGVDARVGCAALLDLYGVVTQIEIQLVFLQTTSECLVIPDAVVAQDLSIVVEERIQVAVGIASA